MWFLNYDYFPGNSPRIFPSTLFLSDEFVSSLSFSPFLQYVIVSVDLEGHFINMN